MAFIEFGTDPTLSKAPLFQEILDLPSRTSPVVSSRMWNDAYDMVYGIYDHDRPDAHPWAVVLQHEKEDYWGGSEYWAYLSRYREYRVNERFHTSWENFLHQSRHVAETMLEMAKHELLKEAEGFNDIDPDKGKNKKQKRQ